MDNQNAIKRRANRMKKIAEIKSRIYSVSNENIIKRQKYNSNENKKGVNPNTYNKDFSKKYEENEKWLKNKFRELKERRSPKIENNVFLIEKNNKNIEKKNEVNNGRGGLLDLDIIAKETLRFQGRKMAPFVDRKKFKNYLLKLKDKYYFDLDDGHLLIFPKEQYNANKIVEYKKEYKKYVKNNKNLI